MAVADFIKKTDLQGLAKVLSPYGYMRNQIIDTLEQDKNFKIEYGMGSGFTFFYKDIPHRINLNVYDNVYELDNDKQLTTLTEVLNALN